MTTMLAMLAALALAGQADMAAPAAAMVEGRPAARDVSPIQERIDHAPTGSVIEIPPGDTSVTSSSIGRCVSSAVAGRCSSVRQPAALCACAPRTSSSKASTSMGAAAATWAGTRQVFMSPAIPWSSATAASSDTVFGVYLREADDATVEHVRIHGIQGTRCGRKGIGHSCVEHRRLHAD